MRRRRPTAILAAITLLALAGGTMACGGGAPDAGARAGGSAGDAEAGAGAGPEAGPEAGAGAGDRAVDGAGHAGGGPPGDTAGSAREPDEPAVPVPWRQTEVSQPAQGDGNAVLRAVRTGRHDGYDRIVLEFDGSLPGYAVRYPEGPLRQCGSGRPITVEAPHTLQLLLRSAAAHDEQGQATVADRERAPGLPVLRSARLTCDFEGEVEWVLGLERQADLRAFTLQDPARLVVDLRHR